jgi:hypothetical protein
MAPEALSTPTSNESAPPRKGVRLIAQAEVSQNHSSATPSPSAEVPPSRPSNAGFLQQVLASLTAIAGVLAVRFLLLLGLLSTFLLAWMAVSDPTPTRLAATVIYDILVFLPLCVLYYRN